MGQINLVQEAIPLIKERGSFTLVSGVLNDEPIFASAAAAAVSGALEGFARAAAVELPKGIGGSMWWSPTILKESEAKFGPLFPGVIRSKAGEWHRRTNARFWGCRPAASTKLIELAQRLVEDRPT